MFRIDRFLTLNVFAMVSRLRKPEGVRIPILMYHSISDEPETHHPYYWINTSPGRFAQHMQFLHDNNYQAISLSEAVNLLSDSSTHLPIHSSTSDSTTQPLNHSTNLARFVVLTFDDGYRDFFTHAFPILKRYGFTATVFLPTIFIDDAVSGLRGKDHLAWSQVRKLQAEGITFGSHTVNHPQLLGLGMDQVEYEIKKSKEIIENRTGKVVDSFCYPYKFPEQEYKFIGFLRTLLQSAGYRACATTGIGCAEGSADAFFLPRLPMNSSDDIGFFKAKIEGGYNWLHFVQSLVKKVRRFLPGTWRGRPATLTPLSPS
jgi:peptidoglycan/xylan/chitin deacetylase (PgdA/CDA1 family)